MPITQATRETNPALHSRAITAIQFIRETRAVEYKESRTWESLQEKITKTALAMSNLRDGGIIVVGISERNGEWTPSGVLDADLSTFDQDKVADQINRYASSPIELLLFIVSESGIRYLIVGVSEFLRTPTIISRDNQNWDLRKGSILCRPHGKAQTRRVETEAEMREILDLAVDRQLEQELSRFSRVLNQHASDPKVDDKKFTDELGEL